MPRVSVIIPTYNHARYVGEAIESVLSQSYQDFEIVVVNDGSKDNTVEVIKPYANRIRYFEQENKGSAAARNFGISQARGELLAFLDSDDAWLPLKLERQIAELDHDLKLGFVSSGTYVIDEVGSVITEWRKSNKAKETLKSLKENNFIFNLTVLVKKKCFEDVGGFDAGLIVSQDYDLWLRLALRYRFKYIDELLAKYRLHTANVSKNVDAKFRDYQKMFRKAEIWGDVGRTGKRIRLAKMFYFGGKSFIYAGMSFHAAGCFIKSLLAFPFVGYYFWPKKIEGLRFSLPYRILNVYLLVVVCLWRSFVRCLMFFKRKIFKVFVLFSVLSLASLDFFKRLLRVEHNRLGLLTIEFFHEKAGGFGGFGKCSKDIAAYFNKPVRQWFGLPYSQSHKSKLNGLGLDILLTRPNHPSLIIDKIHDSHVIFAPDADIANIAEVLKYGLALSRRNIKALLTMEYCTDYQYTIFLLSQTPLIIWIRDPRPAQCLKKIETLGLELDAMGRDRLSDFYRHAGHIKDSLAKTLRLSRFFGRKIIFAATAPFLVERAQQLYGIEKIDAHFLPTPIDIPKIEEPLFSDRPSFCFLGRLDPIKRPWIFCELAKRFKDFYFCLAGNTHFSKVMDPVMKRYRELPNIHFLGHIDGKRKDQLLSESWALINTSIHEGLPISSLEAFSYGKTVISCQDPDGLVSRFGSYTGEFLGDGNEPGCMESFSKAIEHVVSDRNSAFRKGLLGKNYVVENYSFENFKKSLDELLETII